jgi:glycosyltransferase involved in cell wall biosynthesis
MGLLSGGLKVCLLTETFPPEVNGVSFTLAKLARGLSRLGAKVKVLRPKRAYKGADDEPWQEIDLPSCPIPNYPQLRFGLPCANRLCELWQKDRPDIIYLATEGPAGFSALRTARKLRIPTVSGFHTNFDLYLKHYRISLIQPLVDAYLRWFHNRTSATFAPTDWMIEELQNKGYHNLRMLSRGVDRELFSPKQRSEKLRSNWGVEKEDKVIVSVSRIAAEKNLDLTCSLAEQMIETGKAQAGVIVGDGPELKRLKQKFTKLRFTGCLSKQALAEHYASGDVFLFASVTETFGNVVTEALASGTPVVAYDYAAPSEFITGGVNGYLASMNDEEKLRVNLGKILSKSRDELSEFEKAARGSTDKADWNQILEKFHSDLLEILKQFKENEIKSFSPSSGTKPHPA